MKINLKTASTLCLISLSLMQGGCFLFSNSDAYEQTHSRPFEPGKPIKAAPVMEMSQEQRVTSDTLIAEGHEYRDMGKLDAALASFGLALEENAQITEAHIGMGHIFLDRGNAGIAENAYQRAVRSAPNDYDANYYLGLSYQMQDKVKLAIRQYLRAITINPKRVEANRDVASAYLQGGAPEAAIKYARKAVKIDPSSQEAWCNLAATANLLGYFDEAVEAYRTAAELGELPKEAIPAFAAAHIKLKNFERAKNLLESLTGNQNDPYIIERLAYANFKLSHFEDAMAGYKRVLEIQPKNVAALNGIGGCYLTKYLQEGRKDIKLKQLGFEAWRKSLRIKPNQGRIIDLLNRYNSI
ncbi:tetratricopeptide repeat protein [Poriferisphaera corsica]|uniref:Tetratricopeptide repeat protein n=2 Tax=Poriferisphaera corsica TaxID=2528020 RepID=A0A517YQE0_9BACT|nr:tetratricopeptide repeat protein [Poriferisphaera corsica]